jgi:beta-N-acetylhexosaminidase
MAVGSSTLLTPRRRWLAALAVAALAVAVTSGAQAAGMFDAKPDARPSSASPATGDPAGTTTVPPAPTTVSAPTTVAASPTSVSTRPPPPTRRVLTPQGQPDPATWDSWRLAATLVMTGAKMGDAAAIQRAASKGVAGVVLFGPSSPDLTQTLRKARAVAPRGNPPLIASDEEGGTVQRLGPLIYPLPSAEVMGRWSPAKITRTARAYALRMRALGVNVALGPDADLAVPGYYIATSHRSFSADPREVGVDVNAWSEGLRAARVLGVIKHWPGHGQASDTHAGGSIVPGWSVLQRRDLIPFKAAFAHQAGAVMVGHLRVPGLTEGSWPASQSPAALRALRAQAGPSVLIMTDDLSMAAASTTLGISPAQAAVRSLVSGSDIAMACWAPLDEVTSAVTQAIDDGRLPRDQAVASARRVLRTKAQVSGQP